MSQGRFRIDAQAAVSTYNDGGGGVANVRLLIEILDAEGKVVDQVQATAHGNMLARDRLYFEAPLPATGASYRVRVQSWDTFGTGQ